MTNCLIFFLVGNNVLEQIKQILTLEGFEYTDLGRDTTYNLAWKLDIKSAGVDLTATQKTAIKAVAQDLGIYLRWV